MILGQTTPKREISLRRPSPRHSAEATQLPCAQCRCWSGGKPFATLGRPGIELQTSCTRGTRVNSWSY